MFNAMKLIKIFSLIALMLAILSLFLIFFLANKSIPNYNNSYILKEPFGSIRIIRDRYAIPHIFADDNRDIFFGLGFVHAQDRLWQMVLTRRFAYGRLSEVLGKKKQSNWWFYEKNGYKKSVKSLFAVSKPKDTGGFRII